MRPSASTASPLYRWLSSEWFASYAHSLQRQHGEYMRDYMRKCWAIVCSSVADLSLSFCVRRASEGWTSELGCFQQAAVALYSTFSVVSFFAGTIHNKLGSRLTLGIGALGYCLYIGSFLSYNINQNQGFVIAAVPSSVFALRSLDCSGCTDARLPHRIAKGYVHQCLLGHLQSRCRLGLCHRARSHLQLDRQHVSNKPMLPLSF